MSVEARVVAFFAVVLVAAAVALIGTLHEQACEDAGLVECSSLPWTSGEIPKDASSPRSRDGSF